MNDDNDTGGAFNAERLPLLLAKVPNLSEFSRVSGVSRKMLERYRAGMEPSFGKAIRIARALGVPLDALVGDTDVAISDIKVSAVTGVDVSTLSDMVLVPVLDVQASAGNGTVIEAEPVTGVMALRRDIVRALGVSSAGALRVLEARGNSMEPTIRAGDLLLVDTVIDRVADEGIYVFRWNGTVVVKRIRITRADGVELVSDNGGKAEKIPDAELPDLHAAGRVVRVIRAV